LGIEGVSIEGIYQWIWDCKKSNCKEDCSYKDLYLFLRHGRRRSKRWNYRHTIGAIKGRVLIKQRPEVVDPIGCMDF
jgi:IS30 family transposase